MELPAFTVALTCTSDWPTCQRLIPSVTSGWRSKGGPCAECPRLAASARRELHLSPHPHLPGAPHLAAFARCGLPRVPHLPKPGRCGAPSDYDEIHGPPASSADCMELTSRLNRFTCSGIWMSKFSGTIIGAPRRIRFLIQTGSTSPFVRSWASGSHTANLLAKLR
jgi:hypothetical protein